MKKKILIISAVIFILLLFLSWFVTTNVLPYSIIKPHKSETDVLPSNYQLNYELTDLYTDDSLRLSGYYIPASFRRSTTTIILLHGIGDCKESMLGFAQAISNKMHLNVMLFDARAHGKSEGKYCTYGYKEKQDVSNVIDWLQKEKKQLFFGIYGNSLGGAIAIQALAIDERLNFGIIESTFTNLRSIVYDYMEQSSFRNEWIADMALNKAGEIAEFYPDSVSPILDAKKIVQPILLIHGDSDQKINVKYGEQLFNAIGSKKKELFLIKNGDHTNLSMMGGKEYYTSIADFILYNNRMLEDYSF